MTKLIVAFSVVLTGALHYYYLAKSYAVLWISDSARLDDFDVTHDFQEGTTTTLDPLFDRPCQSDLASSFAFCNTSLTMQARVDSLLALLTTNEKISLLGNTAGAVPRLGIPPYQWWGEALHGVANYDGNKKVLGTSFPQVCSLGPSFNRSLFTAIGDAVGTEAVDDFWGTTGANSAATMPTLTYWTPNVNLFRDPRWGRGQEVPGEDPYLTGEYALHLIPALQYGGDQTKQQQQSSPPRPRLAAACKHFYAYSLETDRFSFDALIMDQRDLLDSYLPAFKKCVQAGVLGFMCAYNSINGTPACAHGDMLTRLLRDDWKFDGYITGDCGAVEKIYTSHNFTDTPGEAVGVALKAGMDIDCGYWIQKHGAEALSNGTASLEDIDRALKNLLGIQFRLGYYDGDAAKTRSRISNTARSRLLKAEFHNELALDAARQGIVLLKNRVANNGSRPCLPLSEKIHTNVALLGPNANATKTMQGNYAGIAPLLISPLQGLEDMGVNVLYSKGCNISSNLVPGFAATCDAMPIKNSDATVLVVGLDQTLERESLDRRTLELPPVQHDFVMMASSCAKKQGNNHPVVLVVMSGGPIDLTPYKESINIDAILYVGYPGQAGGTAIAEAMYGKFNPSGRLTTTIYPSDYVDKVKLTDMRMRPSDVDDSFPGRTYRFYQGKAVYPFGFGLSYSKFSYSSLKSWNDTHVSVDVSNDGPMNGHHSILLYNSVLNAGINGSPIKSLVAFDKIFLRVGEVATVDFDVEVDDGMGTASYRLFVE